MLNAINHRPEQTQPVKALSCRQRLLIAFVCLGMWHAAYAKEIFSAAKMGNAVSDARAEQIIPSAQGMLTIAKEETQSAPSKPSKGAAALGDLKSTKTLLTQSAAAEKLKKSSDAQVQTLYKEALEHIAKAEAAAEANNHDEVSAQLAAAKSVFFKAAQATGSADATEKAKREYKQRVESTQTLLEAYKRISNEKKSDQATVSAMMQKIRKLTDKAQQLFDNNDYRGAKSTMDDALAMLMQEIRSMREGSTLVRELHFETKKQEYDYEIDRNNTHSMLVQYLLKEKKLDSYSVQRIQQSVAAAQQKRAQAEKFAADGEFAEGISTLEASTRDYVAAIRSGGIYIPE